MEKQLEYNNPLVYQRADPYVYKHRDGYYYFTGSVPSYDLIEIRRAKTLNGLLTANSRIIWRKHKRGIMGAHIWAPELHFINNAWYIYFAAGAAEDVWNIRTYVLKCTGTDPMFDDWEELGEVKTGCKKHSFTLDMTCFTYGASQYNIWAQKRDEDIGSCLYIAKMRDPLHMESEPMRLSMPEYDWEKRGFKVNEGPAVLEHGGRIFVTYSASDTGWHYCMGMLWMPNGADPMDINAWTKLDKPVLESNDEKKRFGPGHNSFTTDNGRDILIYHSRDYKKIIGDPLYDPNRHARAMVISYDEEGFPVFDEGGYIK
ncbi:MAG: family 43 glycosylhydrolase [Clostridiales bacterium]|nr:family 43 glycosylhydrolase [Clostridiales bacterium]